MSRQKFNFELPERFIIGTVGQPGERQFFLQVRGRDRSAAFALEKNQAAALASRALELLKEVGIDVPLEPIDSAPLETPIEAEFDIGVMTLTWSPATEKVLFEAQAMSNAASSIVFEEMAADDEQDAPPLLQVVLTLSQLRGFANRTIQVVAAGRQPCVFCGGPVDPGGHLCPRANGHRRSG